ncbi:hypothetical protein [Pseudomonas viridiflava]|uniref:hypothetical protein n=1 Tax=Pseudomonas viridiflava TaxID=33069 RepID=UPI0013C3717C|nr:hypothetical protein [Pseudomonas viridiflava]
MTASKDVAGLNTNEDQPKISSTPGPAWISALQSPGILALQETISKFRSKMDFINSKINIPVFKNISLLTNTIELMRRANEVRSEKYPQMAENLREAASFSWFSSMLFDFRTWEELPFVADGIEDAAEREKLIESAYAEAYRDMMPYLVERIASMFPARSFAVLPAAAAHNRGEYALSVPVFLSQAEGVLRDFTSSELFSERKDPITKYAAQQRALIDTNGNWLNLSDDAAWAQLSGDLPIGWGPKLRSDNNYSGLNRNTTLHGIDLYYATERNSLKAFSLLCHVAGIFEWINSDIEEAPQ